MYSGSIIRYYAKSSDNEKTPHSTRENLESNNAINQETSTSTDPINIKPKIDTSNTIYPSSSNSPNYSFSPSSGITDSISPISANSSIFSFNRRPTRSFNSPGMDISCDNAAPYYCPTSSQKNSPSICRGFTSSDSGDSDTSSKSEHLLNYESANEEFISNKDSSRKYDTSINEGLCSSNEINNNNSLLKFDPLLINNNNSGLLNNNSRLINNNNNNNGLLNLFLKLTSKKHLIREEPEFFINDKIGSVHVWAKFTGLFRKVLLIDSISCITGNDHIHQLISKIKHHFKHTPHAERLKYIEYNGFPMAKGFYSLAKWNPLKLRDRPNHKDYINKYLVNTKGFAYRGKDWGRIINPANKIDYLIDHSFYTDARFLMFLTVFSSHTIFFSLVPYHFMNYPDILPYIADNISFVVNSVRDVYYNNICILHQTPSPCECGEALNIITREALPEPVDPNLAFMKGMAYTIGAVIVGILLLESVTDHGVLQPLLR